MLLSGITGYLSETVRLDASHGYFSAIDLLESGNSRNSQGADFGLSVCVPDKSFQSHRFIEHPEFVVAIAGFAVSGGATDCSAIVDSVRNEKLTCLDEPSGRFALTILDKTQRRFHLVTDRIAQYPFYIWEHENGVFWSTSQASFTRLDATPDVHQRWISSRHRCLRDPMPANSRRNHRRCLQPNLAWSFRLSTLGNRRFLTTPSPNRKENYLHASLIAGNSKLSRQPVQERPLWAFTRYSAVLHDSWAAAIRIKQLLIYQSQKVPLEDWPRWFAGPMRSRLYGLLGDNSHIREYVRGAYIDACLSSADTLRLNKLITAEIILRLARDGWDTSRV